MCRAVPCHGRAVPFLGPRMREMCRSVPRAVPRAVLWFANAKNVQCRAVAVPHRAVPLPWRSLVPECENCAVRCRAVLRFENLPCRAVCRAACPSWVRQCEKCAVPCRAAPSTCNAILGFGNANKVPCRAAPCRSWVRECDKCAVPCRAVAVSFLGSRMRKMCPCRAVAVPLPYRVVAVLGFQNAKMCNAVPCRAVAVPFWVPYAAGTA